MELLGTLDVLLLPGLNVFPDRFGGPLDGFGGDFQVCQKLHLLAAPGKGRLAPNGCEHTPHAGGEIRLLDVELYVGGKHPAVAFGAQIIGAVDPSPAHGCEYRPGTHPLIPRHVPTSTRKSLMFEVGWIKLQQISESGRAGLMDGGADGHFHGFEIQLAGFAPVGEDPLELML